MSAFDLLDTPIIAVPSNTWFTLLSEFYSTLLFVDPRQNRGSILLKHIEKLIKHQPKSKQRLIKALEKDINFWIDFARERGLPLIQSKG